VLTVVDVKVLLKQSGRVAGGVILSKVHSFLLVHQLIYLLLTVHLQTLFLHWKELTRESLMLRAQQRRAVQHHRQHLLQKYLVRWKKHHQRCLGKMVRRISNLTHQQPRVGSCGWGGAGEVPW